MKSRDFKNTAKTKMFVDYGPLAGATAIFGAIYVAVVMIIMFAYSISLLAQGVFSSQDAMLNYITKITESYKFTIIFQIVIFLIGALMNTVLVGIMYMCLKAARSETIKLSDMLFAIKNSPDKVIIICLIQNLIGYIFCIPRDITSMMTVKSPDNIPLLVVYYVFSIIAVIGQAIVQIIFAQSYFIYMDNPSESALTCIQTSARVMKNNGIRYFLLFLSFIPIELLAMLTMGVLYIYVLPYKCTAFALFYMQLKGETGSVIDVTIDE